MKFKQIKNDIMEAMQATKPKTSPYDTEAEVIRVDGSTAWVHIPGGVAETPVSLTIAAQAGDTVRVRVSGGGAWLVGNDTAPPTDDTTAVAAQEEAAEASTIAKAAQTEASSAARIASNTAQHFWFTETGTDTGAHITEVTEKEFLTDPANGGPNLLANTNGIAVRNGRTELATFSALGTTFANASGQSWFSLGRASDVVPSTMVDTYSADGTSDTFRTSYPTNGQQLVVLLDGVETAYQMTSVNAYGTLNVKMATAPAAGVTVQLAYPLNISGALNMRFGDPARYSTRVVGGYSVALGRPTGAAGFCSVALNIGTKAEKMAQTCVGVYNVSDDTLFEVGNGESDTNRSNALDVGWDGEVRLALDTTAATGTTDGDLYAAITAAGWASEVIA